MLYIRLHCAFVHLYMLFLNAISNGTTDCCVICIIIYIIHLTLKLLPICLPRLTAVLTRVKLITNLLPLRLPVQLQGFHCLLLSLTLLLLSPGSASAADAFLGCPTSELLRVHRKWRLKGWWGWKRRWNCATRNSHSGCLRYIAFCRLRIHFVWVWGWGLKNPHCGPLFLSILDSSWVMHLLWLCCRQIHHPEESNPHSQTQYDSPKPMYSRFVSIDPPPKKVHDSYLATRNSFFACRIVVLGFNRESYLDSTESNLGFNRESNLDLSWVSSRTQLIVLRLSFSDNCSGWISRPESAARHDIPEFLNANLWSIHFIAFNIKWSWHIMLALHNICSMLIKQLINLAEVDGEKVRTESLRFRTDLRDQVMDGWSVTQKRIVYKGRLLKNSSNQRSKLVLSTLVTTWHSNIAFCLRPFWLQTLVVIDPESCQT